MHDTLTVTVESVRGRYPHARTAFKPEAIDVLAIQSGPDEYLIRLDDNVNPSMWLEIRIIVRGKT